VANQKNDWLTESHDLCINQMILSPFRVIEICYIVDLSSLAG